MSRLLVAPATLALALGLAFPAQARAQDQMEHMDHMQHMDHDMQGMAMPDAPQGDAPQAQDQAQDQAADPHAHHHMAMPDPASDKPAPQADDPHAGHRAQTGASTIPATPPPPVPADHAADRFYDPATMQAARTALRTEAGGMTGSMLLVNIAEYQARKGGDGYRWEGEGWWGGDINRFTLKSEGDGALRGGVEKAEVQGLYSRAIGPWFNLQAGVRQDIRPTPARTYATLGIEGLAPYWFELSGQIFLSSKGDLLARAEAFYDQRITQRLILQPRAELNFAAQDVPEQRIGAGLSDAELDLRLRYEFSGRFAPYIGVSWEKSVGRTADYIRADGEDPSTVNFVTGVRVMF